MNQKKKLKIENSNSILENSRKLHTLCLCYSFHNPYTLYHLPILFGS